MTASSELVSWVPWRSVSPAGLYAMVLASSATATSPANALPRPRALRSKSAKPAPAASRAAPSPQAAASSNVARNRPRETVDGWRTRGPSLEPSAQRALIAALASSRLRLHRARRSTAGGTEAGLGLGEETPGIVHIPGPLDQHLGVPFASRPRRRKEVAAIDVDRASVLADGVHDRMDDVASQRRDITHAERPGSDGLDAPLGAPPEEIVLAPEEDADDRPHLVVMRLEGHPRRPGEVEDGQVGSTMERPNPRLPWLTQRRRHCGWVGNRLCHELADSPGAVRSRDRRATLLHEALGLEHGCRIP